RAARRAFDDSVPSELWRLRSPHFVSYSSLPWPSAFHSTDSGQFPAIVSSALSGPRLARFAASPPTRRARFCDIHPARGDGRGTGEDLARAPSLLKYSG